MLLSESRRSALSISAEVEEIPLKGAPLTTVGGATATNLPRFSSGFRGLSQEELERLSTDGDALNDWRAQLEPF